MSTLLIKNIDTLVSCDAQDHVYTNVNLYCENGLIKSIGNNLPDTADTVIDGTGMIRFSQEIFLRCRILNFSTGLLLYMKYGKI